MSHVNGLVYSNLQDLEALADRPHLPTVLYFFALNRDIHSIAFSGQVMTSREVR
jgi:hypothetical protein